MNWPAYALAAEFALMSALYVIVFLLKTVLVWMEINAPAAGNGTPALSPAFPKFQAPCLTAGRAIIFTKQLKKDITIGFFTNSSVLIKNTVNPNAWPAADAKNTAQPKLILKNI